MDNIIRESKEIINRGDLAALQEYYNNFFDSHVESIDIPYLFRHIYVHACLKKKKEIAAWLKELYETMDPIMKIALRQIFAYGNYLLKK